MSNVNATKLEIVAAAHNFAESMSDQNAVGHSGVKGMKWGVWNDETKRKYGLGAKTKAKFTGGTDAAKSLLSRAASKINAKVSAKKSAIASSVEAKRQKKAELKAQRKELGMSRKDFDKLRETTLKSHDPRVIAKGMHTLTDDELKSKIKRLQEEDKIAKMATTREKSRHEINKTRNEALNANPIISIGKDVASGFLKDSVKELGFNTIVKKGVQPPLEQRVTYAADQAQKKFAREHPDQKAVWVQKGKPGTYNNKPITSSGMKDSSASSGSSVPTSYGMKPLKNVSRSSSSQGRKWVARVVNSSSTKSGGSASKESSKSSSDLKASLAQSKAAFERAQASSSSSTAKALKSEAESRSQALDYLDRMNKNNR